jgi:copper chaperone CopZ
VKKQLFAIALTIAVVALIGMPALSLAKDSGAAAKTTNAVETKANANCGGDEAACAKMLGIPVDECRQLCASAGEHALISMKINGMTCTGCENTISASLAKVPGVVKVGLVNHVEGSAYVLVDSEKANNAMLLKAVNNKGYRARILPSPAQTQNASAMKGCSMTANKKCSKPCATPCGPKKASTAKTAKTDDTK